MITIIYDLKSFGLAREKIVTAIQLFSGRKLRNWFLSHTLDSQTSLTPVPAFTVKVWGGQNEKFQLIIEWKVDLPSLQYLGDQVGFLLKYTI